MDIVGLKYGKNQVERIWRRVVTKTANLSHAHKCAMRKKSETGWPEKEGAEWQLDSYSKLHKVVAEKKKTICCPCYW